MLTNGKRRYVPIPVESNTAKMLLLLRPLREKGDITIDRVLRRFATHLATPQS